MNAEAMMAAVTCGLALKYSLKSATHGRLAYWKVRRALYTSMPLVAAPMLRSTSVSAGMPRRNASPAM